MNLNPILLKTVVDQHMTELLEQARTEQLLRNAPTLSTSQVLPFNPNNLRRQRANQSNCEPRAA
ncbi:hypothetical protein [uncultured Meiothermus sp.]|jgi:hypothetical protein|uniref:hypothetical protein n=1 Tax=uncultured Meiothermus sp. TaxID=157471 RepID=UPI002631CE9E|nr:hypothetical protein [uncultured Meiothermus sp.]